MANTVPLVPPVDVHSKRGNFSVAIREEFGPLAPEILLRLFSCRGQFDSDATREAFATQAADMWAIGCFFFTLIAGYRPFSEN